VIRCSEAARQDPLQGTAPVRRFWWAIDHPGPWPAKPLVEGVLGDIASWVIPLADSPDTTVLLTRQRDSAAPRRVYRADTVDGTLAVGQCGPTMPDLTPTTETITLVCTHGRRDQCCAVLGRPLFDVVDGGRESSHIGGHRFAPTVLMLPAGIVLGRCEAANWQGLRSLGPDALAHYRGRTGLDAPAQVADAEARRIWGLGLVEPLELTRESKSAQVRFHVGYRGMGLDIAVEPFKQSSIPSCGQEPEVTTAWRVTAKP